MEKIASFQVNHLTLVPGVYVSRRDKVGNETLTTFDLRMTRPNKEPVMNTAEVHTLEHLGATFLRNHPVWKDRVIYFGPMGCRTGFYLILAGELEPMDIIDLLCEMYAFMAGFDPFKGDFGFYGKGMDGYAHYKQSMDEINKRAPRAQRPPQNLEEQDAQPDPKSSENDNSLNDNAEILQKITVDRIENPQERLAAPNA